MIYLIDTIGTETGMHKYDEAFSQQCASSGTSVKVISNFKDSYVVFRLSNYYKGNILKRLVVLSSDLIRMLFFRVRHHDDYFIYQSFGMRGLDVLFCIVFFGYPEFRIIVHDLYQITGKKEQESIIANFIYRRCFGKYICHSLEVKDKLEALCTRTDKDVIYFPHLEYSYPTDYQISSVSPEIISSVKPDCLNVLFFGQIRLSKGIDTLLESWKLINGKYNLIIAGVDKGGLLAKCKKNPDIQMILKYVSDNELNYLFSNVDVVVLPYREIYQSGVLETVVHFRKKAILSPVDAFRKYVEKYPSFAVLMEDETPRSLARAILSITKGNVNYVPSDIERYVSDHDIRRLITRL